MFVDRRTFVAIAASAVPARLRTPSEPMITPEEFGARGDGISNDNDAFMALAAQINRSGGGTVSLASAKTYVVGRQIRGVDRVFIPQPILEFHNLTRPLIIHGNGARLRAASGLRFGAFDRSNAKPLSRLPPSLLESEKVAPYWAMIFVRGSRAPVAIRDVELDGNVTKMLLGGRWGDAGWQVPGSGIHLIDNSDEEIVDNILSHHHPLDGAMISGDPARTARSCVSRLICRYNGRQGLSFIGGQSYDFRDCEFAHTGRLRVSSAPGAGVDLEAEDNKPIRNLTFVNCRFVNNVGAGLGADTGDIANVRFSDCTFVGSTNWSAWPRKPGFHFERCTFAGTVVHAFSSLNPLAATKFVKCRFTDDPSFSPSRRLYFGNGASGPVVNLDISDNVMFDSCRFDLKYLGVLPWSWRAIYKDCVMTQRLPTAAMTKGKYLGHSVIDGPVELYGSMILGTVILNGKVVPRGPFGSDFTPW